MIGPNPQGSRSRLVDSNVIIHEGIKRAGSRFAGASIRVHRHSIVVATLIRAPRSRPYCSACDHDNCCKFVQFCLPSREPMQISAIATRYSQNLNHSLLQFGVCLVHRHCDLQEGEMMVATGNFSQPAKDVQCYPEK